MSEEPRVAEPDVPVVYEQPTPDGWEAAFDAAGDVPDEAPSELSELDDPFVRIPVDYVKSPWRDWVHWTPKETV